MYKNPLQFLEWLSNNGVVMIIDKDWVWLNQINKNAEMRVRVNLDISIFNRSFRKIIVTQQISSS